MVGVVRDCQGPCGLNCLPPPEKLVGKLSVNTGPKEACPLPFQALSKWEQGRGDVTRNRQEVTLTS